MARPWWAGCGVGWSGVGCAGVGSVGGDVEGAVVVAETSRAEGIELPGPPLAERTHGAARLTVWAEAA